MNVKVPVLFNGNCFPKTSDFSWLRPLQAVTYAVKVVVSKKWCKIDTFLLHTNGKYHMAYRFVLFAMTFDEVIRVLQDLWNAIWKKFVDISHFNWCSASCGPSAIAELLVITMPSVGERSIVMSVSTVCLCVFALAYLRNCQNCTTELCQFCVCYLWYIVTGSFSGSFAIRCVLPVLWMTPYLPSVVPRNAT